MRMAIAQAIYWGVPMVGALCLAISCMRELLGMLRR